MKRTRFSRQVALAAGLFFLSAAPRLTRGQSNAPSPAPTPQLASPAARPGVDSRPKDIFAGLTFTPEQQAKIRRIHQDFKSRREAVVQDDKLSADQKQAMMEGFHRLENGEVFKVLTPEQQKQIRESAAARRTADRAAQEKQAQPK